MTPSQIEKAARRPRRSAADAFRPAPPRTDATGEGHSPRPRAHAGAVCRTIRHSHRHAARLGTRANRARPPRPGLSSRDRAWPGRRAACVGGQCPQAPVITEARQPV